MRVIYKGESKGEFKRGGIYTATECPKIYDPNTFELTPTKYVISNDKTGILVGYLDIVDIEKHRESQLNEIGI